MKLQQKITLAILSLIIFFGSLASFSTYFLTRREFSNQLTNNLIDNISSHSQESYQIFRQSRDLVHMLAERPVVREYFSNPSNTEIKKQVENHYLDGLNLSDMYSAIYLLGTEGKVIVSTDPRFVGQDYSHRRYFIQAQLGHPTTEINLGITSNELGYYFSSPIYDLEESSKVVGIAVAKLDPSYLAESLLDHQKEGFNIMLTDENGIVVLSSDKQKLFASLGPLPESMIATLRQNNTYGRDNFDVLGYNVFMQEIIAGNQIPKTIKILDHVDKQEEIVSIQKIQDFPFYLVLEGNLKEITRISLNASLVIAAYVGLAALLSIFVIIFVVRTFISKQQIVEDKLRERTIELENLNKLMIGRELKMIELKTLLQKYEDK